MSVYALNKVLYQLARDEAFREAVRADPASALSDRGLEADQLKAMLEADVASLFRMGVHPFLLNHLARFQLVGLDPPTYAQRIKTA